MPRPERLTPEQRSYMARMLREAADFVETGGTEPVSIGGLIWEAMLAVERQAPPERRKHPPAA